MPFPEWLQNIVNGAVVTGSNLFVQSTIIVTTGLFAAYAMRKRGAAVQSVILRIFLTAVLLSPALSFILHRSGIKSVTFDVPQIHVSKKSIPAPRTRLIQKTSEIPGKKSSDTIVYEKRKENATVNTLKQESIGSTVFDRNREKTSIPHKETAAVPRHIAPAPLSRKTVHGMDSRQALRAAVYILMTMVWSAASFLLLIKFLLENLYLVYLRKSSVEAKQSYLDTCGSIAFELGIQTPIVLQNPNTSSPFVMGLFKPRIILPMGKHERALPEREVFLHELAHLKRHDPLWNHLSRASKIIIPFQPLLWILARKITETSDFVCDDYVMNSVNNRRMYARRLAHLAKRYHPRGYEIRTTGVGFISFTSSLRRRIERILDVTHTLSLKAGMRIVLYISCICALVTFVTGLIGLRGKSFVSESFASGNISGRNKKKSTDKITEADRSAGDFSFKPASSADSPPKTVSDPVTDTPVIERATPTDTETIGAVIPTVSDDIHAATAFRLPQTTETDGENEIPEKIPETVTDNETGADNTDGITAIGRSIDQPGENGDDIISADHENNTVISGDSGTTDGSTHTSLTRFEPVSPLGAAMVGENESDVPTPVTVQISYNYRDADRNNPDERKWSDIYQAADRNQKCPIWSPDGNHIAYSDPSYGIWMIPCGGGEPVLVYDNYQNIRLPKFNFTLAGLETLSFSPDGREIAFTLEVFDREKGTDFDFLYDSLLNNKSYPDYDPFHIIACVNIETGEKRIIAEDTRSGSWSRDGRYFVYVRESSPELHVMDLNSGEDRVIMNGSALSPCFSDQNREIYFSRESTGGSVEIFRIPREGGTPEQLTFPGKDNPVQTRIVTDCSPDGEWILFTGIRAERSFLGAFNTLSGSLREIFPGEPLSQCSGKFSSDGKKICFYISTTDRLGPVQKLYLCKNTLPSEALRIPSAEADTAPDSFTLTGNFPNPFNASTTIQFTLPSGGFTRLTVYNVLGQKIRELVAGEMQQGTYSIVWNGKNDYGMTVSNGTYISHLQLGNLSATRRMMLIK
ncbi:T9SS type A sorting domain-containing protein [bacterium]|nr:T9SS type A sorting domain-containing protein [bacterium]